MSNELCRMQLFLLIQLSTLMFPVYPGFGSFFMYLELCFLVGIQNAKHILFVFCLLLIEV